VLLRVWKQELLLRIYFANHRKMICESEIVSLKTELPHHVQPLFVTPVCNALTMRGEPRPYVTNKKMIEIISLRN
jgi:hypothetical protein